MQGSGTESLTAYGEGMPVSDELAQFLNDKRNRHDNPYQRQR